MQSLGFVKPFWSGDSDCREQFDDHAMCNCYEHYDLPRETRFYYLYITDCYACEWIRTEPSGSPFLYEWYWC